MNVVIEHDGIIYVDYEVVMSAMIDRLDAMALDLMVWESSTDSRRSLTHNLQGYAMAIRHLAREYVTIAPTERVAVWNGLIDKLDTILIGEPNV